MAPARRNVQGAPASARAVRKEKARREKIPLEVRRRMRKEAEVEAREEIVHKRSGPVKYRYTEALGQEIHEHIVNGLSLMKIAQLPGMPGSSVLYTWIATESHPLSKLYVRAKEILVARIEEEIQDIADEPLPGVIKTTRQAVTKNGGIVTLEEERIIDNVERTKLRVAARQWTLAHLKPKKHGRQADPNIGGEDTLAKLLDQFRSRSGELEDEA